MTEPFKGWLVLKGDVAVYWPVAQIVLDAEMRRPDRQPDGTEWPTPVWVVLANGRFQVEPKTLLTKDERAYLKNHRDALATVLAYVQHPPAVV